MSVTTYKCLHCGAALQFGIASQQWDCGYCGSRFTLDELSTGSAVSAGTDTLMEFGEEVRAYSCPSCGARIVAAPVTAATFCVFCRNPTLLEDRLAGKYRPSRIIPFKVGRAAAIKAYHKLCDRPLVPRAFRKKEHIDHIRGVYAPFWLFTCSCRARAVLRCEKITSWSTPSSNNTKTDIYEEKRSGEFTFASVPADGSKALDDEMMRCIEPFDYTQLQPFEQQFLAGHLAECYDVAADNVLPHVVERVKKGVEAAFQESAQSYSLVTVQQCSCDIHQIEREYAMAPLWLLTSKHKGNTYVFAMNGQTGKIVGALPLSLGRALAWFGGVAAAAAMLIALVMTL